MSQRFVIEAVMVAIYGQLLSANRPVEYIVPYTTVLELYEFEEGSEPLMNEPGDDHYVKEKVKELIAYFEEPLNKKKIQKALSIPWAKSSPILLGDMVKLTIVNAVDNAHYGELFDPIETEVLLSALKEEAPVLTDQLEMIQRIISAAVPVQVFDIDDFEFALEGTAQL
ncbi:ADP-heptose synthase [Saccharibacillus sp. CPCC 101409]|uniref:ADP-heptose synthase n=1 Tax=Saccharibacillus sp. CPCC 101409 TaxID=3058041 RepID=UPI002672FA95|nr:ADP-heptose synthase [Saccharibacillus sp. CPCC 101409]MDO3410610.1 ADP-heptose synthase [Saccharibacillus sp. CPCC 101409]